jgi:hypothetical protein
MRAALAIAFVAAGILAAGARADGLPVLGVDVGADGIEAGGIRYVVLPAPHRTLVQQVAIPDGRVLQFRYLRTRFTIPAVAYDGSADGLSADGKTLVLIQPRARFPRRTTGFAVLGAQGLRLRGTIRLRGDYSFDAISPDGRTMYLIHYLSAGDPTVYEVRAYDLTRGRLLPDPIVDPYESGEEMRGNPITRAASSDGRWAYTLYDGAGGHPFVHALDTVGQTARCIDLHLLAGRRDLSSLRLGMSGETLAVVAAGRPVARIDTRTFRLRPPETPPMRAAAEGTPLLPVGAVALLLALSAGGLLAIRRRNGEAPLGGASR